MQGGYQRNSCRSALAQPSSIRQPGALWSYARGRRASVARRRGEDRALCDEWRIENSKMGFGTRSVRTARSRTRRDDLRREHTAFSAGVGRVVHAIVQTYRPIHLNYQLLGNVDPHVDVHVVPRFDPDPAPSLPLPDEAWQNSTQLSSDEMHRQVTRSKNARYRPEAHSSVVRRSPWDRG
jgi:hypothetical protein